MCVCVCVCVCVLGERRLAGEKDARPYMLCPASSEAHACAGKLGLASVVQFIPLPVIGGYLAFVGYFCLKSGTTLATGVAVRPERPDQMCVEIVRGESVKCRHGSSSSTALETGLFAAQ